jgi:NADH dehydrogenase FAD-containing subunit
MQRHNVNLILGDRAASIWPKKITLASGNILPSDCSILSSWIKINDEAHTGELDFECKAGNYCALDSEHIYCAGDVAIDGLHTTAHNAMLEGRRIWHLIADKILDQKNTYPPLEDRTTLGMALWTSDGLIVNEKKSRYIPHILGFMKKIVQWRVLFEFKRKIMLWV